MTIQIRRPARALLSYARGVVARTRALLCPVRYGQEQLHYESNFIAALREMKGQGVKASVFGDIDIDDHRRWEENVCEAVGIDAYLPLWQGERTELLEEFLSLGFEAMIVTVKADKLGKEFLGRTIDAELADEFEKIGVDECGENGEYHSIVTRGPLFATPLLLERGAVTSRSGCWSLDVHIAQSALRVR